MTATILPFPSRPGDQARIAIADGALRHPILPTNNDAELQLLIQLSDKLIDNLNNYMRPDSSGLMDEWLSRLDAWESKAPICG